MSAGANGRAPLRFMTCGSVDDGKSTLIGRLLYDIGAIHEDHLAGLARDSGRRGAELDFSLLLDGLEAEREQNITIDVSYRYFATPRRSFVIADSPGHLQYTRNMATAASASQAAVILVDATKGLQPQTRRHAHILSLFGIRRAVLALNKIDLVQFSQARFEELATAWNAFAIDLALATTSIPLSARLGDNVARRSTEMPWYEGPTLLEALEQLELPAAEGPFRFPVQWVNPALPGGRGYAGTVAGGRIATGDDIVICGSAIQATIRDIVGVDGPVPAAAVGDAVTLILDREVDVSRGSMLAASAAAPHVVDQFAAHLVWLGSDSLLPGRSHLLRVGDRWVTGSVTTLKHRLDIDTNQHLAAHTLRQNDIGFVNIATDVPVAFDTYARNAVTGSFILVDRISNETLAAGMIAHPLRRADNLRREVFSTDRAMRAAALGQRPLIVWLTGLSGAGKSSIADLVEVKLLAAGLHAVSLDGDNLRHGLCRDLGFTDEDRVENIRRAREVAKLMLDAGLIVLCSFVSPFRVDREAIRNEVAQGDFLEVYVDAPLQTCIERDTKGLYAKALAGGLPNLTGIGSPYEPPLSPDLHLLTGERSLEDCAGEVVDAVLTASRRSQAHPH